ncbi:MAG: NADH-quinone oxidoreductase subunit N [Dehalococcoidaceae bacterium]|nr:NADH-quinone oxidoreductase subunit N [Dehalococcoidaceae bacterium]
MNWPFILPEIIIAVSAVIIILADLAKPNRWLSSVLALAGITAAAVFTFAGDYSQPASVFNGMLTIDGWSQFLRLLLLAVSLGVLAVSIEYYRKLEYTWAEFHALSLFALAGMMLMSSAADLVSAFIAIEITAISFFVMVGMLKDARSSEASLKMMLIGGIASAIMLYGMALVFGSTAGTRLNEISLAIGGMSNPSAGLLLGMLLLLAGLLFEAAAVPFHMWAPDAYEGAPTPITLYLSAASKIAGIAIIARVFTTAFSQPQNLSADWGVVAAVISALTMTLGNILALSQTNIKRLLAYSGIAHTGYMLIGISVIGLSQGSAGQANLLFYMAAFALAELSVFSMVIVITRYLKTDEISGFAGLSRRSPRMFALLCVGLFSLTGLPPTAGFMAKLFIFTGAVNHGLLWLIIIAVLNTVISAYYYLKIIKVMWMDEPAGSGEIRPGTPAGMVAFISAAGIILLGIAPYMLLKLAEGSLLSLP